MTLFCPNCGKPNLDSAFQCVACGTELKPKNPAKFKGTMMMSGVSIPKPDEGGGAPPGGPPPGGGFGGPPMGGPPPGGPPPGGPPPGGGFGHAPGGPPPGGPPPGGGFGAPGGPPPGAPPGGMAFQKTMAMSSPLEGVSPPGGFGTPAPGSSPGTPVPGGGFGGAPPPGGGFGGAPPPGGGFGGGAPPPGGGFGGAPPPGGGFGAPGGAPPPGGGFGAPPPQPQQQQGFGAPPATAMVPPKKKSKTGLFIGIGCLLFLVLGCLGGVGYMWWAANNAVDEFEDDLNTAVEEANEAANNAAEPAAGGGGPCTRIAGCCRAYVSAMGASVPASTCDAYNNVVGMQDSMCEQTISGYRTGLQAMGHAIPSECN